MRLLTVADFAAAADRLGCAVAAVQAVVEVESGGGWFTDVRREILDLDGPGGFLDGPHLPKILFEAHWFSRLTGGRFDGSHPAISSPRWDRGLYVGGEREYARLHAALQLDAEAALKSASWGLFQIMGFNHAKCGFGRVERFVDAMKRDEAAHLAAFVGFVIDCGLDDELRRLDWAGFAYGYNGAGYAANDYDGKLDRAYRRFAGRRRDLRLRHRGDDVTALQRAINDVAVYRPALEPDGIFGPATAEAVTFIQTINGLPATGVVDAATRAVLNLES